MEYEIRKFKHLESGSLYEVLCNEDVPLVVGDRIEVMLCKEFTHLESMALVRKYSPAKFGNCFTEEEEK
jgi:hypothetical protein